MLFKIYKTSAEKSRAEKVHDGSACAPLQTILVLHDDAGDAQGKFGSLAFHP